MQTVKTVTQAKIKVNDKCSCGSNNKYKKCCMQKQFDENAKWTTTQSINSKKIKQVINILQPEFDNICIIDITDNLSGSVYETYQIKNYYTNIMMIAERNTWNEDVFKTRSNSKLSDIIVMYHGAYRTFNLKNLLSEQSNSIIESINQMI